MLNVYALVEQVRSLRSFYIISKHNVLTQLPLVRLAPPSPPGIPAFFTPTAAGTVIADGGFPIKYKPDGSGDVEISSAPRETRVFNNVEYVMEEAITGDISLVKAWKADTRGNLVFRGTARNFNPDCARAGKFCIAEVEEIVEAGELDPDEIHLPGVFVNSVVKVTENEKRIEQVTERAEEGSEGSVVKGGRGRIVRRAAKVSEDWRGAKRGECIIIH